MSSVFQSPIQIAFLGFSVGVTVAFLTGTVGFDHSWERALIPAIGNGIGIAVGFYIVSTVRASND